MDIQNTLPYLFYGRIVGAAAYAMARSPQFDDAGSSWYRANRSDDWRPERTHDRQITYTRVNHPGAVIVFDEIQLTGVADTDWGSPITTGEEVIEEHLVKANVPDKQSSKTAINHKFAKTTTLNEAAGVSATLAMEAQVGYTPGTATGGAGGHFKLGLSVTGSYEKKWGSQEGSDDAINVDLPIQGPYIGLIQVKRSRASVSVHGETTPEFEGSVKLYDNGALIYQWATYEELLSVLRGEAPTDRALAKAFTFDPFTRTGGGISDAAYRSLTSRRLPKVHWNTTFDKVSMITLNWLPDYEAMGDTRPAAQVAELPGVEVVPLTAETYVAERRRRKKEKRARRKARRRAA